jgi:hypothetical protein
MLHPSKQSRHGVMVIISLHLVPKIRMPGDIPPTHLTQFRDKSGTNQKLAIYRTDRRGLERNNVFSIT